MPPLLRLPLMPHPLVLALCALYTPFIAQAASDAPTAALQRQSIDSSEQQRTPTPLDTLESVDQADLLAIEQWAGRPAGFLSRAEVKSRPDLADRHVPVSCHGIWVTPIPAVESKTGIASRFGQKNNATSDAQSNDNTPLVATADYGYYSPDQGAEFSGQVLVHQDQRLLEADRIQIDASQTIAEAQGNVRLSEAGLTSESETLRYNLKDKSGVMTSSTYISEPLQAHGKAASVNLASNGITTLQQVDYSTCEPDHQVWNLHAASLALDNDSGLGTARDTVLYIHDVPVIKLPWFKFPIDDRRMSGMLVPRGGYTNDGGLDLSLPYYFNLASNYDLTLTPRLLSRRQAMLEGEFRLLTADYGQAIVTGGFLPNDPLYNDEDRERASLRHEWRINSELKSLLNLNYVSDKDYFSDLGTDPLVTNQLNQERSLSLFYDQGAIDGLSAIFRVQDFQTVDPDTADVDRPYARLPQLLVNYQNGSPLGWQYNANHDSAYFKKSITDGSGVENSGLRVYNQLAARYNWRSSWGSLIPEFSVRNLYDRYDQDSQDSLHLDKNDASKNVTVPQFTLDGRLVFERDSASLQTIEPRLFYAYAPYKNQEEFPNFDSAPASLSYSQLFSPYRFVGHDRLEDNHFASVGLTHRLYGQDGLELLSTSIGQRWYFDDRKVRLNDDDLIDDSQTSGPALEVSSQLTQHMSLYGSALWLPNGKNAQTISNIQYQNKHGQLYQVGYYDRKAVTQQNQEALQQFTASLVQPLYNQWRAFGYIQYDLQHRVTRDSLLGFDYDGCCWRMALYGRSYYNDLDEPANSKPRRVIMAEFTLKGLAGLSGNLSSLLSQKILGYTQVNTSWSSR